jgi:hypothetical protein
LKVMARDIGSPDRSLCAVALIVGPSMLINNPKRNVIGLRIILLPGVAEVSRIVKKRSSRSHIRVRQKLPVCSGKS